MPTNAKTPLPLHFVRAKAQELDRLTNQWFASSASKKPCLENDTAQLVGCVNDIGEKFGILGGAVAIVNRATNAYLHLKHYPGDTRSPLLPYPEPPHSKVYSKLQQILTSEKTGIGDWIHQLFEIRRNQQKAETDEPSERPESEREGAELCVLPDEICNVVQEWVDVLTLAEYVREHFPEEDILTARLNDLESKLPTNFFASKELAQFERRTFLLDCLKPLISAEFKKRWPNSIEVLFFSQHQDKVLGRFFGSLKLNEIRHSLLMPDPGNRPEPFGEYTIPQLLKILHGKRARFPIVEYLVLTLLWGWDRDIYHTIWPFVKTLTYDSDEDSKELSFSGVLLLTFGVKQRKRRWNRDQVTKHLSPFFLLMKVALEPFADTVFYGDMQRYLAKREATDDARRVLAHQIKDVSYYAGEGWLVSPQRWAEIQENFSSQAECAEAISDHLVAPVPSLYRALSSTLMLWSLSYLPGDLFPNDGVPANFAELTKLAWQYALQNRFVIGSNFDFSEMKAIEDAWLHKHNEKRTVETSGLETWMIDHAVFKSAEDFRLTEDNKADYKELSGVLRVLVVACENFLKHVPNCPRFTIGLAEDEDGDLHIVCSNEKKVEQDKSEAHHMGFRGLKLIDYLCRDFIGIKFSTPKVEPSLTEYRLHIPIGKPKWLRNHQNSL
jgi:hypothetical protein